MNLIDDPDVQRGVWATFTGLFMLVWLWFRRKLGHLDTISNRVTELEKTVVPRTEIKSDLKNIEDKLDRVHKRIDYLIEKKI